VTTVFLLLAVTSALAIAQSPRIAASAASLSGKQLTLADIGSTTHGGVSDPVVAAPTQEQLQAHLLRIRRFQTAVAAQSASGGAVIGIGPDTVAGDYNYLSANVGTALEPEPNTYACLENARVERPGTSLGQHFHGFAGGAARHGDYRNYCGPGATRVVVSNWTATIPSVDTVASAEHTHAYYYYEANYGTYVGSLFQWMLGPLNSYISYSYYMNSVASGQAAFDDYVGGDTYSQGRPLITALMTSGTYNGLTIWLNGWDSSQTNEAHIVSVTGFNFSNPVSAGDNIYYQETSGSVAGTNATGRDTYGANKMWSLVWLNNGQIW